LFAVAMTVSRSAASRYGIAVATLVLMMASPVITLTWMRQQTNPAMGYGARGSHSLLGTPEKEATVSARSSAPFGTPDSKGSSAVVWLVEVWFLGVLLLSLRTAGGLLLISRMRRQETKSVGRELYERCLGLQQRMGLDRVIRYCECSRLDAPAVLGWFRPVVLLPLRALSGLTEEQIEAVIAHELAHIRRLDCFVNLFQIAVETLLFYHPAVWWVSQQIRTERENCCDDEAIAVCGDRLNYARALTLMEEWRTAPSLMMAANRGPLAERVFRLLGLSGASGRMRMAGLGIGVVCLMSAFLAGNAFLAVAHSTLGASVFPKQTQESGSVIVVRPTDAPESVKRSGATAQASKDKEKDKDKDKEKSQQKAGEEANKKESYLDAMEAAGLKNLSVDELIAMKIQGVTPEYIKGIRELGLQPTPDELIGMRVQGITPEYIRDMKSVAANLSVDELIGMKVQGITLQYVKGLRELGLSPDADELVGMKVQGITPEYVRELRATGLTPNVDELIGMKVQGVTAEYVKGLQAAGFKNLDSDELIGAKVQGITPEFIEKARRHGFQNLTLDKLIALKHADIL
jgi:beta-lactamase regulating signal transducer with metallopeptidase domain